MDDAVLMGGGDRIAHLRGDGQQSIEREATLGQDVGQRAAFDQRHRDEMRARGFLDRIDVHDGGMVETRERSRLALESLETLGIRGSVLWQELQCDLTAELGVTRTIHLTHSPCPERGDDFVRTESRSRSEAHSDLTTNVEGPAPTLRCSASPRACRGASAATISEEPSRMERVIEGRADYSEAEPRL